MKINIYALMSAISEANETIRRSECAVKEKPEYLYWDSRNDYYEKYENWRKTCLILGKERDNAQEKVYGMFEVLCMGIEEQTKALSAARALERWQESKAWCEFPSDDLIKRIGDWIFKEKSIEHYEMENDRFRWNKEVYAEFVDYWE